MSACSGEASREVLRKPGEGYRDRLQRLPEAREMRVRSAHRANTYKYGRP